MKYNDQNDVDLLALNAFTEQKLMFSGKNEVKIKVESRENLALLSNCSNEGSIYGVSRLRKAQS